MPQIADKKRGNLLQTLMSREPILHAQIVDPLLTRTADRAVDGIPVGHHVMSDGNQGLAMFWNFHVTGI